VLATDGERTVGALHEAVAAWLHVAMWTVCVDIDFLILLIVTDLGAPDIVPSPFERFCDVACEVAVC